MIGRIFLLFALVVFTRCSKSVQVVNSPYEPTTIPSKPDYTKAEHWASLPGKRDAADSVPLLSNHRDEQKNAAADLFFVYPTIYTGKPSKKYPWNADVNDAILNKDIQTSTILNQASIFNGTCRVYAPYYRCK